MLFQTQKQFFVNILNKVAGLAVPSKNPLDPAQYITVRTVKDKKSLALALCRLGVSIRVNLADAGNLIDVGEDGAYAINAQMIQRLFSNFDIDGNFVVDFVPVKMQKAEGTADEIAALNKLGHFNWNMPSLTKKKKERWATACEDAVKDPDFKALDEINKNGGNTFEVDASVLAKFIGRVGFAVGKDQGNPSFRNVLIRIKGQKCEIVTASLNQLALGNFPIYNPTGDFAMAIPWEDMAAISAVFDQDPERKVKVSYQKGSPGLAFFEQGVKFGDNENKGDIGRIVVKAGCSSEPFVNFDKIISQLDFRYSCKINRQQLKPVCGRLAQIKEQSRTETVIDSAEQTIEFAKTDDKGRTLLDGIPLDITDVKGGDFGIVISSDYLKGAIDAADANDVEIKFTGTKGLLMITPLIGEPNAPELVTYIQPFGPIPTATKA
jgi:DNA polymerase III sliding clamp (beta) subunit (PCNA family)